jgi:hypothetical protein
MAWKHESGVRTPEVVVRTSEVGVRTPAVGVRIPEVRAWIRVRSQDT